MKLLAPAGDFESLKSAVYNGADEVYLGVKEFNARNNIQGFSMENLGEAVNFAHIYGVRVFLAVNILFNDLELQSAIDVVVNAYNMGVDAFIVQDLGLANILITIITKTTIMMKNDKIRFSQEFIEWVFLKLFTLFDISIILL
jgi:putative protease